MLIKMPNIIGVGLSWYEGSISTAGTSVTISDPAITANTVVVSVLSSIVGDRYTNITCSSGSCVITFATSAIRTVRIYIDERS